MQKTELVYLHALLAKTHEYLAGRHDLPETFDSYEAHDVGPYQIQHQKAAHETAVRFLSARLAAELSEDEREGEAEVAEA
jgi:hypothetical protein